MKKELFRKGIHVFLALSFVVLAPLTTKTVLAGGAIVLFIIFSLARALRFFHIAHVPRVTFGELFFAVGVLAVLHMSWPNIVLFQTAMVVLALSDPFAALIGVPFGRHTYSVLDEKRSYEGSGACFLVTFFILIFFQVPVLYAGGFAFILTLIEAISLRGSDNLTLPISVALLLTLV